jgi:hypothetical protein
MDDVHMHLVDLGSRNAPSWPKCLRDGRKEVRRGAQAVCRIVCEHGDGGLQMLAKDLLAASKKPASKTQEDTRTSQERRCGPKTKDGPRPNWIAASARR